MRKCKCIHNEFINKCLIHNFKTSAIRHELEIEPSSWMDRTKARFRLNKGTVKITVKNTSSKYKLGFQLIGITPNRVDYIVSGTIQPKDTKDIMLIVEEGAYELTLSCDQFERTYRGYRCKGIAIIEQD